MKPASPLSHVLVVLLGLVLTGACASAPQKKSGENLQTLAEKPKGKVDAFAGTISAEDDEEDEDSADTSEPQGKESILGPEAEPPTDLVVNSGSSSSTAAGVSEDLEKEIEAADHGIEDKSPKIPVEINKAVEKWIHYFTVRDSERFQRFIDRGAAFKEIIEDIFEEYEIPKELYFLAMIESGFSTHATSHASAVGVWQFMRATGRLYGLKTDYYVDERRDPIRATEAAAKYLRLLYQEFDSWYLAMAAYNAGEGRISRGIRKGKTNDFWDLAKRRILPKETVNYVPKYLAAVIIGRNPEKYKFSPGQAAPYPDVEAVEVPSPVRLTDIAEVSKIPLEELKQVNPHLLREVTPPGLETYEIWVPQNRVDQLYAVMDRLPNLRIKDLKPRKDPTEKRNQMHTVKAGETLASIADDYGLSSVYLKKINAIKGGDKALKKGSKIRLSAKKYRHKKRKKNRRRK